MQQHSQPHSQPPRYHTIGPYRYKDCDLLGTGYQSTVYRAVHSTKKIQVALKVIDLDKLGEGIHRRLLEDELKCLEELKGTPYIINLIDIVKEGRHVYVVTELCKGDLGKHLKNGLTERQAWRYLKQMIAGYRVLCDMGLLHRDLKPDNLFLKVRDQVKIGDFGFATTLAEAKKQTVYNIGSPSYMAPEVLRDNEYSFASDVWSIGVSYYEMVTGKLPWQGQTLQELKLQLTEYNIQQTIENAKMTSASKMFLQRVLCYDPKDRLTPQQLTEYDLYTKRALQDTCLKSDNLSVTTADSPVNKSKYSAKNPLSKCPSALDLSLGDVDPFAKTNTGFKSYLERGRRMSLQINLASFKKEQQNQTSNKADNENIDNMMNTTTNAFKKKHKNSLDVNHRQKDASLTAFSVESIHKMASWHLKLCNIIFCFVQDTWQYNNKSTNIELNVFKVCLKNFMVKTMEKLQNLASSDLLAETVAREDLRSYVTSEHYLKMQTVLNANQEQFRLNEQLAKHWPIAREQKVKSIKNAAYSFIKQMRKFLLQNQCVQSLKLLQSACMVLEMLNTLQASTFLLQRPAKYRQCALNKQAILSKALELQKLK